MDKGEEGCPGPTRGLQCRKCRRQWCNITNKSTSINVRLISKRIQLVSWLQHQVKIVLKLWTRLLNLFQNCLGFSILHQSRHVWRPCSFQCWIRTGAKNLRLLVLNTHGLCLHENVANICFNNTPSVLTSPKLNLTKLPNDRNECYFF